MATAAALPAAEQPVVSFLSLSNVRFLTPPKAKPARSMIHPVREAKGNTARRKNKQGEQFDPEELSRRLTAHLAEQKMKAEQRREARAAKAASTEQNVAYHHVPTVAAAAFERTTTPSGMKNRPVHKASQSVLKAHLGLVQEDVLPGNPLTVLQETQAKDQAMIERELVRNRNQFQWTRDMEEAVEIDEERDLYKAPQRTFPEFAHLRSSNSVRKTHRTASTGDVFSDDIPALPKARQKPKFDTTKDRNDWVQRDKENDGRRSKEEGVTPYLRKKKSIWVLGRKEKSSRQDKDEEAAGIGIFGSPPDKKLSFLARFKRHPN